MVKSEVRLTSEMSTRPGNCWKNSSDEYAHTLMMQAAVYDGMLSCKCKGEYICPPLRVLNCEQGNMRKNVSIEDDFEFFSF